MENSRQPQASPSGPFEPTSDPLAGGTHKLPSFSVIIPTYNRAESLGKCLHALSCTDYPRTALEVVIVDDGGEQSIEPIVEPWRDRLLIHVLKQKNGGPAAARNLGAGAARGDWLVFLDDDCKPQPEWLRAFAAEADDINAMLGGVTVNGLPANPYSTASQLLVNYVCEYFFRRGNRLSFFTANNFVVSAAGFREVGGFDSRFPRAAAEDRDFCCRWLQSGRRLRLISEAVVQHAHQLSFASFLRQHFRYGEGAFIFRSVAARDNRTRVSVERFSFYAGLVTSAFRMNHEGNPWGLSMLLLISQLAHLAGFLYAAVFRGSFTARLRPRTAP